MLSSHELHTLYEGLRLNSMNQYDYVLTGKAPGRPASVEGDVCRPDLGGTLATTMPRWPC